MEIPKNAKTYELSSSILWFDEDGILYSIPKPGIPPELSHEQITEELEKFKKITGGKKVCMIAMSNPNAKPPAKKDRDFIADLITGITKAIAIVTTSPVSKMITNIFFALKPPSYPAKMFTNEKDAKEWIKKYL